MAFLSRTVLNRTVNGDVKKLILLGQRTVMQPVRHDSTKPKTDLEEQPLPFSKSKAASWSAKSSFSGRQKIDEEPWYQPFVISFSFAAILLWFCVLREENDLDRELDKTLYDRVAGMEEKQLELSLIHNQSQGLSTKEIRERLNEIRSSKN